jgi:hypothetical protein
MSFKCILKKGRSAVKDISYWKAYISGIIIHANFKPHNSTEDHVSLKTLFVKNRRSMNPPYVPECTNSLALHHIPIGYYENYNGKTLDNHVSE